MAMRGNKPIYEYVVIITIIVMIITIILSVIIIILTIITAIIEIKNMIICIYIYMCRCVLAYIIYIPA